MLNKILKALLIADLLAVNGGVGYLLYKTQIPSSKIQSSSNDQKVNFQTTATTEYVDRCGEECMTAIAAKVEEQLESRIVEVSPTVTPRPTAKPGSTLVKKTRREELLTIPGSGSSVSNDWTALAETEFYFDTRDYPGIVEVYFEANMKLVNGNGAAYVRLYDITNAIGVGGSENNTTSQSDVWTKSQKVYFWAGRNLIRVQAKSLTADTTVYNKGRLRVVVEN